MHQEIVTSEHAYAQELGAHGAMDRSESASADQVHRRGQRPGIPSPRSQRLHTQGWAQERRAYARRGGGDQGCWALHPAGESTGDQRTHL